MKAWLVVNAFLQTNKFNEIHQWILDAASKKNIDMKMKTNDELLVIIENDISISKEVEETPDFVLFWDKDIRLAKAMEVMGYKVFNSSKAIEVCDDKSWMHLLLGKAGIHMPRTILAPMTYANIGYTKLDFIKLVEKNLGYPLVIKECFGSFGEQVYLCYDEMELLQKIKEIDGKPMLFQEYIKNSFGRDIRLQVVGDKVVTSMYRYSENGDFRANITNGGKMKPYEPTKAQIETAVKCCEVLGLDFAGVDLLFGEKEEPIVCEVNSNAHFKNIYDCTGVNTADYIMDYILEKIKSE